jgi:ABC-2 family transporter protein
MISYIVKEKELRQKELMKMMSVTEADIGLSWFFTFLTLHFFTALFVTILSSQLYSNSAPGLLWFFWILAYINIIVFSMFISTLTSKTTRGVLIGLLLFFGGVFLTLAVSYENGQRIYIQLISLHPVAAMSFGLQQIGALEENGTGLNISTIGLAENASGYSFQFTLRIMMGDSVIWGILTWYLNRVIKPDYGQALPLWFPFTLRYWMPSRAHLPVSSTTVVDKMAQSQIPYEDVGDSLKRQASEGKSIEIHDLKKIFGEKAAVDGLTLSMYSSQITALLGHNGRCGAMLTVF